MFRNNTFRGSFLKDREFRRLISRLGGPNSFFALGTYNNHQCDHHTISRPPPRAPCGPRPHGQLGSPIQAVVSNAQRKKTTTQHHGRGPNCSASTGLMAQATFLCGSPAPKHAFCSGEIGPEQTNPTFHLSKASDRGAFQIGSHGMCNTQKSFLAAQWPC